MQMSRFIMSSAVCASMLLAGCSEKGGGGNDEPKTYTITVTSGGNGTASADKAAAEAGATVTLTATPNTGYSFDKWTVESGEAILPPQANVFTMPADNVRIKAEFAEIPTYTIIVIAGANGMVEVHKESAAEGETITLTAIPYPGYSFDKWTVESGSVELSGLATATFTMPAENVVISAKFIEGIIINGVRWAYTNAGAANPEDSGLCYQWNRSTGWSFTDPLTGPYIGAVWNSTGDTSDEWTSVQSPCPNGWRISIRSDFEALVDSEKTTNKWESLNGVNGRTFTDISGNSVFFPASGSRQSLNGALSGKGTKGIYWVGRFAYYFGFNSNQVDPITLSGSRASGYAVRCVAI